LRTTESFIKTYGIIHPGEQYESDRDQRLSPMHASQQQLGAVFFETAGWERPFWYGSNQGLLDEYGGLVDRLGFYEALVPGQRAGVWRALLDGMRATG
jgi:hypothetical protein